MAGNTLKMFQIFPMVIIVTKNVQEHDQFSCMHILILSLHWLIVYYVISMNLHLVAI